MQYFGVLYCGYSLLQVFRGSILRILQYSQYSCCSYSQYSYCSYSQYSQYSGLRYCSYSQYSQYSGLQYCSYSQYSRCEMYSILRVYSKYEVYWEHVDSCLIFCRAYTLLYSLDCVTMYQKYLRRKFCADRSFVSTELVFGVSLELGIITNTGCAGCRWVERAELACISPR